MDKEEIQAKLDMVNREIAAETRREYVDFTSKDESDDVHVGAQRNVSRMFTQNIPAKTAWIAKKRADGTLNDKVPKYRERMIAPWDWQTQVAADTAIDRSFIPEVSALLARKKTIRKISLKLVISERMIARILVLKAALKG